MMRTITLILFACSGSAQAVEQRIDCPTEIKRETIQITQAPAGWTPFYLHEYEPGLPLNGAGLMWGPPSSIAMAKASWSRKIAGQKLVGWSDLEGKNSGAKWMACYYGDHDQNDAILSRPIDENTTECIVTYPRKRGERMDIRCTW